MASNVSNINQSAFPKSKMLEQGDFLKKIDDRLKPYVDKWELVENYGGTIVRIPGHSDSKFEPVKYFEVIKKKGEPFYREDQRDNEIGLTLWAHWPGYDHECEVNLFITGKNVLDNTDKVSGEIIKTGGAKMQVKWNGKNVTNFETKEWFYTRVVDKIWIDDMKQIL